MFKIQPKASEIKQLNDFLTHGIPVSFLYDGAEYPLGFTEKDGTFYSDDKTLRCDLSVEKYDDAAAVEYLPRFTCVSGEKTGQIKNILVFDRVLPAENCPMLYFAGGTHARIDDFAFKSIKIDKKIELTSNGSGDVLPFFNLQTGKDGVIFGLGYTGWWHAVFEPTDKGVHVKIGLRETDFHLIKDESVRTIKTLVLFWNGELSRSFNLLRNFLVRHCIPVNNSGEPFPLICCSVWGGLKTENQLKLIDFIKKNDLKYDCYWMDAGWHGPDHDAEEFQDFLSEDWAYNQGDWSVNRVNHPDGLSPISKAAHDAGMRLLLWFGTYVCTDNIGWHKDHPEWSDEASRSAEPYTIGMNKTRKTVLHKLNFNDPEARRYIIDEICKTLKESGADCYREDTPPIYGGEDDPGRIGLNELKAVEYLYEYWDELHEKFPGLIIDNCGGGGTHIDLETLSRSYVFWRTDYNCNPESDPTGQQIGNYGISHFVPLVGGGGHCSQGDTYKFRSNLCGPMPFGIFAAGGFGPEQAHTEVPADLDIAWYKQMLDQFNDVKRYLSGSFYPLTGCSDKADEVISYRFDRPDLASGIILTFFRPECKAESIDIAPALPNGEYVFYDYDTRESFEYTTDNKELLTVDSRGPRTARLLKYTKK
mgnify:CR=1 FL=1